MSGKNFLLFLDEETSGLPNFKLAADDPAQPYIASICGMLTDQDLNMHGIQYTFIRNDGWSMQAEATRANGITDEHLQRFGIPQYAALLPFAEWLSMGVTMVAHNVQFDWKILRGNLRRVQLPDYYERTTSFCTMHSNTGVCKLTQANGARKTPSLAEAFKHWFPTDPQPKAHTAYGDVLTLRRIYQKMRDAGMDMTPKQPKSDGDATNAPRPQNKPSAPPQQNTTPPAPPIEPPAARVVTPTTTQSAPATQGSDDDLASTFL